MAWGASRSGRAAIAYLALIVPALLLAAVVLALAVAAAYAALPSGNAQGLAAGAAALSLSGLLAAAHPWTQSARATRGRSLRVLLRALALAYIVAVVMSAPAAILLLAQLGPAALAGMAVVLRILTTVMTAVLTGTATTPLYLALTGTTEGQPASEPVAAPLPDAARQDAEGGAVADSVTGPVEQQ